MGLPFKDLDPPSPLPCRCVPPCHRHSIVYAVSTGILIPLSTNTNNVLVPGTGGTASRCPHPHAHQTADRMQMPGNAFAPILPA